MRLFLLILLSFISLAGVAHYDYSKPQFMTSYLHGSSLDSFVEKLFRNAFSWDKDLFVTSRLEKNKIEVVVEEKTLFIHHYFMVGDGFSKDIYDSLQLVAIQVKGSDYLLFHSGVFMPECGGSSWDLKKITFKPSTEDKTKLTLNIERHIYGCPGEIETSTAFKATYDLKNGKLEKLYYVGKSL